MAKKNPSTVYGAPVDLEKGNAAAALKEEEEEVDPNKAKLISRLMDAYLVVYVLFFIGISAYMVKISNNTWDMCLGPLVLLIALIPTFVLIPKLKKLMVKVHATTKRSATMTSGSNNDDLSTKLLAS